MKTEAVLFTNSGEIKLAVAGFGIDMQTGMQKLSYFNEHSESRIVSPEMDSNNKRHSKSSDIWSIGIIMLELCLGKMEYSKNDQLISEFNSIRSKLKENQFSDILISFIFSCLEVNPTFRSDIKSLLNHPFISNSSQSNKSFRKIEEDASSIINELVKANINEKLPENKEKIRKEALKSPKLSRKKKSEPKSKKNSKTATPRLSKMTTPKISEGKRVSPEISCDEKLKLFIKDKNNDEMIQDEFIMKSIKLLNTTANNQVFKVNSYNLSRKSFHFFISLGDYFNLFNNLETIDLYCKNALMYARLPHWTIWYRINRVII